MEWKAGRQNKKRRKEKRKKDNLSYDTCAEEPRQSSNPPRHSPREPIQSQGGTETHLSLCKIKDKPCSSSKLCPVARVFIFFKKKPSLLIPVTTVVYHIQKCTHRQNNAQDLCTIYVSLTTLIRYFCPSFT